MLATILATILKFLEAFSLFAKYFPPKTEAEKQAEIDAKIAAEKKKEQESGRPTE